MVQPIEKGVRSITNTPICDFVQSLNQTDTHRFFMPGHKGKSPYLKHPLASMYAYDITEITGADALFEADGIIGQSEQNAAALFGARDTLYSTEGSTLCIQTMLALAARRGKKIIAGRNAHMAFVHACILLGLEPVWLLPEQCDAYGVCGRITPEQVEQALRAHPDAAAVYITSPDYLGNTAEIGRIAEECGRAGVPLLCDNAHGAYLRFTGENVHPLQQGVTMCCDSAHKTLPVLTGGAYLHLGECCPFTKEEAKLTMNLFGSTSPSYLILQSLDLCNRYLSDCAEEDFARLKKMMQGIREELTREQIPHLRNPVDFAKLTIDLHCLGLSGDEFRMHTMKHHIECEYYSDSYAVLLLSPFHTETDVGALLQALKQLPKKPKQEAACCAYTLPPQKLFPHEAYWMKAEEISVEQAVGRIAAQTVAACPPGVPVVMPGEQVTKQIKNICKNGGNLSLKVVK